MHRPTQSEPEYNRIIQALDEILSSEKFAASPQMSAFLRYVVEQAANGNRNRIKAYTVAIDALGKPDTFDPQNDPVVRVLAGRLRASLNAYYNSNPETDVLIEMKPGSYAPGFICLRTQPDPTRQLDPGSSKEPVIAPAEITQTHFVEPTLGKSAEQNSPTPEKIAASSISVHTSVANSAAALDTSKPAESKLTANGLAVFLSSLLRFPFVGVAVAVLSVGVILLYQNSPSINNTVAVPADSSSRAQLPPLPVIRHRSDQLSVFVSGMESGNTLKNQLNTMISGVFSESENLRVYRILESVKTRQYWPEDYLVSLDVLPLLNETRVSVQLVDAQTGRISHTDTLALGEAATQGLSGQELTSIMEFARHLISEDGPLFQDYKSKLQSLPEIGE